MIRTVHVFQCGSADLYGVTRDQTGANLPTDECSEGWRFIRTMEMEEGLPPRGMVVAWQERDAAVRAAIADHGFFIGEAVALPAEYDTPARRNGQHETTIQSPRSPSGGVGARSSARKREPRINIQSPFSWLALGIVALVGVFAYVGIKSRRRTDADR
jgi:hypothetical protein